MYQVTRKSDGMEYALKQVSWLAMLDKVTK